MGVGALNKSIPCLAGFSFLLAVGYACAHSAPLSRVAVEACKEKEKSQVCQYEGHHDDLYLGTCQYVSDQDLICVRNKPIQKMYSGKVKSEVQMRK